MVVQTGYQPYSYKPGSAMAAEAIPFPFRSSADLIVSHIADSDGAVDVLTLGDDYAIGGNGGAGTGTITATASYPADDLFLIERATPRRQQNVLAANEIFPAADQEDALDQAILIDQEQDEAIAQAQADADDIAARAVRAPAGETLEPLPSALSRAGKFMTFVASGAFAGALALVTPQALADTLGPLFGSSIKGDKGDPGSAGQGHGSISSLADAGDDASEADDALLMVTGRFGTFKFREGDWSAQVASDPHQGMYIARSGDATGATGAWIRVVEDYVYHANWWSGTLLEDPQDIWNSALKIIPVGSTFHIPAGHYLMSRATAGTVNAGSASKYDGVIGAVYVDKDDIRLTGCGYATHLDGQGDEINLIMGRGNRFEVSHLRCSNGAGQLITNESAGVCYQPSNFAQIGGTGSDIAGCYVHDCYFEDLDTGVTATAERQFDPIKQYLSKKLHVERCQLIRIRRQGVETVADNSIVNNCYYEGADKGVYILSRFVRVIGSRSVKVINNFAIGFDQDNTGYNAVQCEGLAFYGYVPHYEVPADVQIIGNHFENFGCNVQVDDCQGSVQIHDNNFENFFNDDIHYSVRILSTGIRDPGQTAQSIAGDVYTAEGHGLATEDPIQTLTTINGLTAGVTYYAIRVDDDNFKWATSAVNAAAGTAIALSGTSIAHFFHTVEKLEGRENKLYAERISVRNNTARGCSKFFFCQGTIYNFEVRGNEVFSNDNSSAGCIDIGLTGTHPLENISEGAIVGNTLYQNDVSNVAPISISGLKADAHIDVDDNKYTPSANGATISHSGLGTVQARDYYSNVAISRDLWLDFCDPPRYRLFTGNP